MTQEEQAPLSNTLDGSSSNEPSTSALGAYSEETEAESTITSSTGWTKTLRGLGLDREALSPRSQAVLDLLVEEMSDGFSKSTLAAELEQKSSWASNLVNELRDEVLLNSGQFFPLSDQEFEALKISIQEHGIRVPLLVGDHILIDGNHRLRAASELGMREVPVVHVRGMTVDQEREVCVALNVARRHLSHKQKRSLIRYELVRDSTRSSRRIASICGVDSKTVESVRRELAAEDYEPTEDEIEAEHRSMLDHIEKPVERRIDARGREMVAYVEGRGRARSEPRPIGSVTCCHGQEHAIFKEKGFLRAEPVDSDESH